MLQLTQSLLNRPVMSLRNGRPVAQTLRPIINPNNLKLEGFYCQDSVERKKELILLYQDIRDIIPQGIVVDDHDVLVEASELVRLQDVLAIQFDVIGLPVYSDSGRKLGKVNDFATEVNTFYIQKLYVSPTLFKALGGGGLSVDRTQIVEITTRKIIIKDPLQPMKNIASVPATN